MYGKGYYYNNVIKTTVCINRGTEYTFESGVGKSRIDITLATPNLARHLRGWRVNKEINYSDHHSIEFSVGVDEPTKSLKKNWNKLDVIAFKEKVKETCNTKAYYASANMLQSGCREKKWKIQSMFPKLTDQEIAERSALFLIRSPSCLNLLDL